MIQASFLRSKWWPKIPSKRMMGLFVVNFSLRPSIFFPFLLIFLISVGFSSDTLFVVFSFIGSFLALPLFIYPSLPCPYIISIHILFLKFSSYFASFTFHFHDFCIHFFALFSAFDFNILALFILHISFSPTLLFLLWSGQRGKGVRTLYIKKIHIPAGYLHSGVNRTCVYLWTEM